MLRFVALAGLAMTLAGSPEALAEDATFFTVTYIETGPILAKGGASTLNAYREAARKENGVVFFEVFQRIDRPNQFAVLGAWANQMAYDAHAAGDNAKKFTENLVASMRGAPPDTRLHNALAVGPSKPGKDAVFAI